MQSGSPFSDHAIFGDFTSSVILSAVHFKVGADNILHLTFQRREGKGAYIEKTTLTELMVKSTQQQPVFPSSI